jgi:hypothetical protein
MIIKKFNLIGVSLVLTACGIIPLGQGTPNDAVPSGTIVTQATINSLVADKSVTGNATIYNSAGTFILRLETLSAPNETGLLVMVNLIDGSNALRASLRAISGNQNYTIGSIAGSFANAQIYSTSAQTVYGQANFPPPVP